MRRVWLLACAGCSFSAPNGTAFDAGVDGAVDAPVDADIDAPIDAELDAPIDAAPVPWWNDDWTTRMPLAISSTANIAPGFQVGVPAPMLDAACGAARKEVRIVHGAGELPRVIDETPAGPWIWFRLADALPATDYWIYCHNPGGPAAPMDPTMVFDLYDDFPGGSLRSPWLTAGTVAVAGKTVTLSALSSMHTTTVYPVNTAVDFSMATSSAAATMWFWGGFQNGTAYSEPWALWNAHRETVIHPEAEDSVGTMSGTGIPLDTAYHLYSVENYGAATMHRREDAPVIRQPTSAPLPAMSIRIDNYMSSATTSVRMVRVRAAADPPPVVTVGAPEHQE